mgnify:CR=1 FL=1
MMVKGEISLVYIKPTIVVIELDIQDIVRTSSESVTSTTEVM